MVKWHEDYSKEGLIIIDIDNGRIDTKKKLEEAVENDELPYAVLHDKGEKNCKKYGIKGYPTGYLVDVEGKVIWEGFPLPKVKNIEKLIKKELENVKKEEKKEEDKK